MINTKLQDYFSQEIEDLLTHKCNHIPKELIYNTNSNYIDEIFRNSSRNVQVLKSLSSILNHGRLSNSGYVSILPVDQSIEHSAAYSFAKNPIYFDPENIIKLAIEGGCNAVATTFGNFSLLSRKYAHKIPFIVKINHNECLTYPDKKDQIPFGSVREAWNLGATAIGATIYFCSENSSRQISEVSKLFEEAHELGLATILWCYPRNSYLKTDNEDYHTSADITGQSNHIGVTIQADMIKQKLPTTDRGFEALQFGKYSDEAYNKLTSPHPIDLCRYQVANCYMGKIGLINSGGESKGKKDIEEVIRTAIINKRAGGMGLISGRKAFQKPFSEGVKLLNMIQDVYLDKKIDIA